MSAERRDALLKIYRDYDRDPAFVRLRASRWPVVPGRGSMNPRYVFVADVPGQADQAARKPFVGAPGDVMARLLTGVNIERHQVFITYLIKYQAVNGSMRRRNPDMAEQLASRVYLMRELDVFGSTPVVAFGSIAVDAVSLFPAPLADRHGRVWNDMDRTYAAMYHPATAVYDPAVYDMLAKDLVGIIRKTEEDR